MNRKVIALDLDGTLLNSKGDINPLTKQTLIALQQQGHHVVLATGRPTPGVLKSAAQLELDQHDGYVLTFNGGHVMNYATGEVIYENPLQLELAKEVLSYLKNFDVVPMIYLNDYMYVEDVYAGFVEVDGKTLNILEYEARSCNYKLAEVDSLLDFITTPLSKILITGNVDYLAQHVDVFKKHFEGRVTIAKSAPFFIEFTNNGVDKGKSLEHILKRLDLTKEAMISFGDGMNDYSMLKAAGIGVAMGNAQDQLKEIADFHTTSNDEDGIVHALKQLQIID